MRSPGDVWEVRKGRKRVKKLMIICLIIALAMAVLDATYSERIEPDEVFPMANQHIVWTHEKNP